MENNSEALESFRKVGQANKDKMTGIPGRAKLHDGKWSREYVSCFDCGTSSSPHFGNGLCKTCWSRKERQRLTDKKNTDLSKNGIEGVDFIRCAICNKPFEIITSDHLKEHETTHEEYKNKFPTLSMQASSLSIKRGIAVSRGRTNLMKRRGYLNPESQRNKKRAEMVKRHSTNDFSKVSFIECKLVDWFLLNGYNVMIGEDNPDGDGVLWQCPVLEKYCVDFAYKKLNLIIEVLGDWWHGWKYLKGEEQYDTLHPKVKRNLYLDKSRFEEIEKSGLTLIKIWEHEIKDHSFENTLRKYFIENPPIIGETSDRLLSIAKSKYSPSTGNMENVPLSSIAITSIDKWNARWLISQKEIKCSKSMLAPIDAEKLRLLLAKNKTSMVPKEKIEEEFTKARQDGFPYYDISDTEKDRIWRGLYQFIPTEPYAWNGYGTNLASFFHPQMFECKKKNKMTPMEFFNSEQDLKRGIEKVLCLYGEVTVANLREICRNEKASSRINNFPPRVAKTIVRALFPSQSISVLDPCAGFSGRLLGCSSCDNVVSYHGIDLSSYTVMGLNKTADFIKQKRKIEIKIEEGDCLNIMPQKEFDLIITSPPFLDVEEYKGVPFNSNYSEWLRDFVTPFFINCKRCLIKETGRVAIYTEFIQGKDFTKDCTGIANSIELQIEKPIVFTMSYGENNRNTKTSREIKIMIFSRKG